MSRYCPTWSVVQFVDSENQLGKPFGAAPSEDSQAKPDVGPDDSAAGTTIQRLFPEMRRPKPNQEAIAAALQAMQRLTMKMDSESSAEESTPQTARTAFIICSSCGHKNREANKFCGMCGLPVEASPDESPASELPQLELPNFGLPVPASVGFDDERPPSRIPYAAQESEREAHPAPGAAAGQHHYHHHYHHHYFQGGAEGGIAVPRGNAPDSARETDRMRIAAAAKGEPMSRSEAAVRRVTQEWVLACNTRQLDELLDLYAPDAVVVRSNLPLLRGAAAVREFFFSAIESGLGEVAVEPIRVEVLGDLAHEVGRYSALVPGTAGKRREERGKYLWVFAKQSSGDWKLVSECWSSDLTLTGAESDIPKSAAPVASKALPRKA
ncbi:MAG: SgcJ/EcaC family oxidoreductase [Candidatus Sulfotelmatobacter sp.]